MKAILVMEMPENCAECPCSDECVEMCLQMESPIIEVNGECEKPDWCPLIPMPERKQNACSHGFAGGWNACLDAIEGSSGIKWGIWKKMK